MTVYDRINKHQLSVEGRFKPGDVVRYVNEPETRCQVLRNRADTALAPEVIVTIRVFATGEIWVAREDELELA